jgi:hypothetical protein
MEIAPWVICPMARSFSLKVNSGNFSEKLSFFCLPMADLSVLRDSPV